MREQESPSLSTDTLGVGTIQLIQVSLDQLSQLVSEKVIKDLGALIQNEVSKQTQKEILTRDEVMSLLGVGATTLHNWNKNEILMPFRVGNKVYYNYSDIVEFSNRKK